MCCTPKPKPFRQREKEASDLEKAEEKGKEEQKEADSADAQNAADSAVSKEGSAD